MQELDMFDFMKFKYIASLEMDSLHSDLLFPAVCRYFVFQELLTSMHCIQRVGMASGA